MAVGVRECLVERSADGGQYGVRRLRLESPVQHEPVRDRFQELLGRPFDLAAFLLGQFRFGFREEIKDRQFVFGEVFTNGPLFLGGEFVVDGLKPAQELLDVVGPSVVLIDEAPEPFGQFSSVGSTELLGRCVAHGGEHGLRQSALSPNRRASNEIDGVGRTATRPHRR